MTTRKKKAPGKHYRNGLSLLDLFQLVPNEEAAEDWYIKARWPNGPVCPKCGSNNIHERQVFIDIPDRVGSGRVTFRITALPLDEGQSSADEWVRFQAVPLGGCPVVSPRLLWLRVTE